MLVGRPDEPVPAALSGYVTREMARAEALLKVIGSRPDNLADNFATLMPNAPPALYQRILELKACCPPDLSCSFRTALQKSNIFVLH